MLYIDQNEFNRRATLIDRLGNQHPELLRQLPSAQRLALEDYYLASLQSRDPVEFRRDLLKRDTTTERRANQAYEHFLSLAGVPEMLIAQQ